MHSAETDWQWCHYGGAGRVDPDGQMNSDSEDSDEPQTLMSKRKWNGRELWTMIKRWMTGHGKIPAALIFSRKFMHV